MAKNRIVYCCAECGAETVNWAGKCPSCGAWNSLQEFQIESPRLKTTSGRSDIAKINAKRLIDLNTSDDFRYVTGITELDRVLGGGAVLGSLILVGGAPGIGKSTLLLQVCNTLQQQKTILYVTGEESERQIRMRADRLHVSNHDLFILAETDIDTIAREIERLKPELVIVDSIQTMYTSDASSTPGSPSQIRECTMKLLRLTKEKGVTVFLVGHITKEGGLAGPKILEHMVDCVLYFEGERESNFRILRAAKNRFGSTNEIGVFEMESEGLICVSNPSEMLLSGRPENCSGTCVTCSIEGTRPILAEIQALVSSSGHNAARRSNGIDYNRAAMLIAVLEKRAGFPLGNCDTYINVVGGLTLDEPAADLATVLSLSSSYLDRPLGTDLAAIGEIGLSGELRQVMGLNQRLAEIHRLGFKRCVISSNYREIPTGFPELQIIPVPDIRSAIAAVLGK